MKIDKLTAKSERLQETIERMFIMPVMDAEKEKNVPSTEEIEEMYGKIQQNKNEDMAFAESLDKYLANPETEISPLKLGITPNSLTISGANPDLQVVINPSTIKKCMSEANEHYHGHGLSEEIMKQLPSELRNPTMIFKGSKEDSLVAITELKDKENRGIMVAVSLSEKQGFSEVNRISSAYGRNNMNNYLKAQIEQGNLLAANKEKADKMLHSIGLQLPRENTFISFDNSIAYSMQNVKASAEKITEILQEKPTKKLLPVLNAVHQKHESRIESLNEKRATREDKIAKNTAKIDKLTAKSERLQETNEMLKGLSSGVLSAPIKAIIERNQRRIDKIQDTLIPNREAKIEKHLNRISVFDRKIAVSQAKADKIANLSSAIKSFAIRNPEERRKQFTQSMDGLHDASKRTLAYKIEKCDKQLKGLTEKYISTESSVDKLNTSEKISNIQSRKQALTERMGKLSNIEKPFAEHTPEQIDKLMIHTESEIENAAENRNITLSQLAENTVVNSSEYLKTAEMSMEENYNNIDGIINNLPPEKESEISPENRSEEEKEDSLDTYAARMETNCLFSIEQNGERKEYLSNSNSLFELLQTAFTEQSYLALMQCGTPVSSDVFAEIEQSDKFAFSADINFDEKEVSIYKVIGNVSELDRNDENSSMETYDFDTLKNLVENIGNEITNPTLRDQALENSLKSASDSPNLNADSINNNIPPEKEEKAEIFPENHSEEKDSPLRLNIDYYHKIPSEHRHMESFKTEQAANIIDNLAAMGIEFSALSAADNDMVTIAIDDSDKNALKEFAEISEKIIKERAQLPEADESEHVAETQETPEQNIPDNKIKVNPEYYSALPEKERLIVNETKQVAEKIMQKLDEKNIPYSAVGRGKSATAITVSKANEQQFREAETAAKSEHIKEFINHDFYQQLPKDDRYTQRMSESEVRHAVNELKKEGVEHSAVIDGNKSAVTVAKKDKGMIFFSIKQMKINADKIAKEQREKPKQEKSNQKPKKGEEL